MKKHLLSLICIGFLILSATASADLDESISEMLNAMVNTTSPGTAQSQSRGVLSGGSIRIRFKASNPRLINLKAPSIESGCGGINFHGGSLSFINVQAFKDMLTAIAAGGGGYAFKIALDAMCPTCQTIMSKLQDMINKMNKFIGNSCQVASSLINNEKISGAIEKSLANNKLEMMAQSANSAFDEWIGNTDTWMDANSLSDNEKLKYNVSKRVIRKADIRSWYPFGDLSFEEMLLSMTGMVIQDMTDEDGNATEEPVVTKYPPRLFMKDILYGGQVEFYKCTDGDPCLKPVVQTRTLEGVYKKVRRFIVGDATHVGLQELYATNSGNLSDYPELQNFIGNNTLPVGAMLHNLAAFENSSSTIVDGMIDLVALEATRQIGVDMLMDAYNAAQVSTDDLAPIYEEKIKDSIDFFQKEYSDRVKKLQSSQAILNTYKMILESVTPRQRGVINYDPKG